VKIIKGRAYACDEAANVAAGTTLSGSISLGLREIVRVLRRFRRGIKCQCSQQTYSRNKSRTACMCACVSCACVINRKNG